jgi:homoserine/homoserine lactone efflux protein
MNWHLFTAFLAITLIVLLTPGPIVTLVIATGASKGVRAALTTVAGTTAGSAALMVTVTLGLGVILSYAAEVFEILRWGGAAYLVYLGVMAWRGAGRPDPRPLSGQVHFRRGFLVGFSNPKGIAFFTAFLPQFVDPGLPAAPQLTVMCTVAILLGCLTDTSWAVAAGLGHRWFMQPLRAKLLGRLTGLTLIGGGLWLSLARRPV